MRLSLTLSAYIGRQLAIGVGMAFFALIVLILLFDSVELTRRASGNDNATMGIVVQMAFLHLPYLSQRVVPYAVLVGVMLTLARLTRTSELVVARAASRGQPRRARSWRRGETPNAPVADAIDLYRTPVADRHRHGVLYTDRSHPGIRFGRTDAPRRGQRRRNDEGEAERSFQKAIEVAQSREAKSFELRAATSLARLWRSHGKRQEAQDLLAPVYNYFTEGFDTAELKDAKALLDELK